MQYIHTHACPVTPEPWWWSPGAPSSAESTPQTGDQHGQLLLQILHLQYQRSDTTAGKHFHSLTVWSVCLICVWLSFCRGVESGRQRGSGCSHGWSLHHRTGAHHGQPQTEQHGRPGPSGTDRYQSKNANISISGCCNSSRFSSKLLCC